MTSSSRQPVWTSLRELIILVLGILIAFGLDSWWDRRLASSQRGADLSALEADFTENRTRLAELVAQQERIAASSARLVQIAEGLEASPDTVRTLVGQVFSSGRFEPVMGAYRGLVASGALTRLRNAELQAALADFAAALDIRYVETYADALYFDLLNDFQSRLGPLFDKSSGTDFSGLLGDPPFQVALHFRASAEREVGGRYEGLLQIANHVLALLENP